jgi:tRNA nucleotidyltransferase (CCA-adding enzyme)
MWQNRPKWQIYLYQNRFCNNSIIEQKFKMKIFVVGGFVRDKLLGITAKDKDYVVVGASVEAMLRLGFKAVGKDFPVFLHPQTHEEYALARTERKITLGYQGFTFYTSPDITLEEDLRRRDLTINALAMDEAGQIYDYFNGQQDLANRILRHTSPAFLEDPLRVLRLARFMATLSHFSFAVAPETLQMIALMPTQEFAALSCERI